MCLILFAWKSHPDYPLVVAANRDEFYERDTEQMNWWVDHPHVLAGKDKADVLGSPGTWLGFSKTGRFAALTNVRAPSEKKPDARTRGELSSMYLTGKDRPSDFIQSNSKRFQQYNGFNLLMADLSDPANAEMHWVSNRLMLLADTHEASDHELPSTGVSKDWEKALSPAFIKTPVYGTRSSTVLRVRKNGTFEMVERRFDANGTIGHDVVTGALTAAPGSNLAV